MLIIEVDGTRLEFEHSLVALSRWEAIHEKPFFAWKKEDKRTHEEMLSYFEQMLVRPSDRTDLIARLTPQDHMTLVEHINASRTATIVREPESKPGPKENVTSELIYYWMVSLQIPFEAETWHLSRLMTLIRVCGAKSAKPKKQPASTVAAKYRELNEQRKKQLGTSG